MSATAIQSNPAQLNVLGHYSVSDGGAGPGRPPRSRARSIVYDYPREGHGRGYFVE